MGQQRTSSAYPICIPGNVSPENVQVPVVADFGGNQAELGASLRLPFGMALWLALAMHAIGVEIYLRLTPREHERLRQVSYEKQLEAGMKDPGSAGLVVQKVGDANPWVAKGEREFDAPKTTEYIQDEQASIPGR